MYNKLYTKILDSSIWLEPNPTRIVWITFLAAMDEDGFAQFSSVRNLANRALVTPEEAEAAVKTLESPDAESANKDHEGRRIERVPGGWMILNANLYRDIVTRTEKLRLNRERVARHRAKKAANSACNAVCNAPVMQSYSESYSESYSDLDTDTESNVTETLPDNKKSTRTATRIPEGFGLTPEREAYAVKNLPKVDAAGLMEAFRDHWTAASGQKARKVDWDATWRTWVRNANQFGYPMITAASAGARPPRLDANGRAIVA